jgi:hypothetical protein
MVATRVGMAPTGTLCTAETREAAGVVYSRIDAASVDLINWPASAVKPAELFARCG